jgi:hypothetical protein
VNGSRLLAIRSLVGRASARGPRVLGPIAPGSLPSREQPSKYCFTLRKPKVAQCFQAEELKMLNDKGRYRQHRKTAVLLSRLFTAMPQKCAQKPDFPLGRVSIWITEANVHYHSAGSMIRENSWETSPANAPAPFVWSLSVYQLPLESDRGGRVSGHRPSVGRAASETGRGRKIRERTAVSTID